MPDVRSRPLLERIGLRGNRPERDSHGTSLTASAHTLDLTDRSESARLALKGVTQAWHADAWTYRRSIGEVRYLQDWLGVAVSRMRLYVGVIVDGADEPVTMHEAQNPDPDSDLLPANLPAQLAVAAEAALFALGDPASLLERAAVNLEVTGELYLVGYLDETGAERWEVRSCAELVSTSDGWVLQGRPGRSTGGPRPTPTQQGGTLLDPATSYAVRIWRSDAQWTDLSASAMSSVLDHCEELLLLGRKLRASTRSRIGAGLLAVPSELDFQPTRDPLTGEVVDAVEMDELLLDVLVTPIADESAASAVVPAVVKGPAEYLKELRRIDLGRPTDPTDKLERDEALGRVLNGLDAPAEIVTGFRDVKYANAKAIDDGSFRYNVEPKVLTIVHALTTGYLRTRLLADPAGFSRADIDRLVVWYDPSALTTPPDQGTSASEVHKAGELSGAALRRYRGFDEADAPTQEERDIYLEVNTRGKLDPGSAPATPKPGGDPSQPNPPNPAPPAVPAAALLASARARMAALDTARPAALTAAARPSPLGEQLLRIDLRLFDRLQGAADGAMSRALERAGAKARTKARGAGIAAGTPNDRLVSVLGADGVTTLGLTTEALLSGDPFGELAARFEAWAEDALEAGLRAAARALGVDYPAPGARPAGAIVAAAGDPLDTARQAIARAGLSPAELIIAQNLLGPGVDFTAIRAQAADDRRAAADKLRARLTALAAERLYAPDVTAPDAGEHDPSTSVPPGVLRAAMARAGGADSAPTSSGVDDDGRPVQADDPLPGGVASGWSIREATARAGLTSHAYAWSHGTTGSPFDPHLALDGQAFTSQLDTRLRKAPTSWPYGSTSYFPGDHAGCTCWTEYLYDDPYAGLPTPVVQSIRAAQQARDDRGRFLTGGPTAKGTP